MAYVRVDFSTSTEVIRIDKEDSSFSVMVCASYTGRGLDGRELSKSIRLKLFMAVHLVGLKVIFSFF